MRCSLLLACSVSWQNMYITASSHDGFEACTSAGSTCDCVTDAWTKSRAIHSVPSHTSRRHRSLSPPPLQIAVASEKERKLPPCKSNNAQRAVPQALGDSKQQAASTPYPHARLPVAHRCATLACSIQHCTTNVLTKATVAHRSIVSNTNFCHVGK